MLAKGLRDDGRSMSTVPGRRAPDHVAAVPLMEIRWRTLIFVFRALGVTRCSCVSPQ